MLSVCLFSITANVQAINPDLDVGIESISVDWCAVDCIDVVNVCFKNEAEVEISPGDNLYLVAVVKVPNRINTATPLDGYNKKYLQSKVDLNNSIDIFIHDTALKNANVSFCIETFVPIITHSNGGLAYRC